MKISIRKLRASDHTIVFALFSDLMTREFPEYSENTRKKFLSGKRYWSRKNYLLRLLSKNRLLLGAFDKRMLVGLLDAEMPFGGVSMGVWLMIDPPYQRQKIGTRLIEAWEQVIRKRGGHFIYLYTQERNIGFYEKLGFTKAGMFRKAWFGLDDIVYTKLLQEPSERNFLR
jgi:ribosomal protein S18 acetylase RimI-like enzyme